MAQKDYWDSVSEGKEFTTPFLADVFKKYVKNEDIILDVGCGYGRILKELKSYGFKNLIGCDFSEKMIERGKRELPGVDFLVRRSDRIEMEDSSVDAVILMGVLTCIVNDDEQRLLIEEIRRVLKPNGILYINDFLLNTDDRNKERYDRFVDELGVYGAFKLPEGATLRHHSEQWINELLSGLKSLEYEVQIYNTMNGHKSNGFCYVGSNLKQS